MVTITHDKSLVYFEYGANGDRKVAIPRTATVAIGSNYNVIEIHHIGGVFQFAFDEVVAPVAANRDALFLLLASEYFTNEQGLISNNTTVSKFNPLYVSGEYMTEADVDWVNSDFTGWVGEPRDLLRGTTNGGIYNSSATTPKTFTVRLLRTMTAREIGLGTNTGSFAGVKISALGSGGTPRAILDQSIESVPATSLVIAESSFVVNAIVFEFHTSNRVDVTNIFAHTSFSDIELNSVHKWGLNDDVNIGANETVWKFGGLVTFTTIPQLYYISSSSATDTNTVQVEAVYQNSNGRTQEVITTVQLNGQTPVAIGSFLMTDINRLRVVGDATGSIYVYETTATVAGVPTDTTKVRGYVRAGDKQTMQAIFRAFEFNKEGRKVAFWKLVKWEAEGTRSNSASGLFNLRIQEISDTVSGRIYSTDGMKDTKKSGFEYGLRSPAIISSGSRLWVNIVDVTANNVSVTARFTIIPVLL